MEEKLNKILDMMISGAEKGAQIIGDNAVPLLEEYYKYKIVNQGINAAIWIITSIAIFYIANRWFKQLWAKHMELEKETKYNDGMYGFLAGVTAVIGIVFGGLCLGFGVTNAQYTIAGLVAPKAYVIDKLKSDLLTKDSK